MAAKMVLNEDEALELVAFLVTAATFPVSRAMLHALALRAAFAARPEHTAGERRDPEREMR